jgi:hypothetical protein
MVSSGLPAEDVIDGGRHQRLDLRKEWLTMKQNLLTKGYAEGC